MEMRELSHFLNNSLFPVRKSNSPYIKASVSFDIAITERNTALKIAVLEMGFDLEVSVKWFK